MSGWLAPRPDDSERESVGEEITRAARSQAGYFTTGQALRLGFSVADISDQVADGAWVKVERDLYRLKDHPRSDFEEFAKWCTWFGSAAAVSHQSAAELHGLGHLYPRFIHLSTVLSPPSPTQQLALHRHSLSSEDCEQVGPLRITTPKRTALDLAAGGISQELLDEVVADGVAIDRLNANALYGECGSLPVQVAQRIEHALAACT
ncbi:type IV toxin-antitoxin system AbiEi family antitoxin domain-containing protein [Rhodococcus sp. NPDC049939]|uniref:type IV toxin-antitoxin system AbiEi family antitoxin domain-containing protein n=1 Tax=Rhodococcus sp. NPDC049939 TaxID=3155511 RepID=UPI0033CC25C9